MQINKEETGHLAARIKIRVEEGDYLAKVEEKLKDQRKKASVPGFRAGKVPTGMIKRMYGKSLMIDEINTLLSEQLSTYLEENELSILGYPLANTDEAPIQDWDAQKDFEFWFDIGLAPEIKAELENIKGHTLYQIEAEDEKVENYIKDLQRRLGEQTNPEVSEAGDVLKGLFTEVDENGEAVVDGISNDSSLAIDYVKEDESKAKFIGLNVGDSIVFNPTTAINHVGEIAAMLNIKREIAETLESDFRFTLTDISRMEPADLNAAFFAKVFPGEEELDEAAFRARIKTELEKSFEREAETHFFNEAVTNLMETEEFPLPEEFLKRWLIVNSKAEMSQEELLEQFPAFLRSMRWQLLQDTLLGKHNISVEDKEIRKHIQSYFQRQFMLPPDAEADQDEELDPRLAPVIDSVMSNTEEVNKIKDQLIDEKMIQLFLDQVPHESKKLPYDDFLKLVTESNKK